MFIAIKTDGILFVIHMMTTLGRLLYLEELLIRLLVTFYGLILKQFFT